MHRVLRLHRTFSKLHEFRKFRNIYSLRNQSIKLSECFIRSSNRSRNIFFHWQDAENRALNKIIYFSRVKIDMSQKETLSHRFVNFASRKEIFHYFYILNISRAITCKILHVFSIAMIGTLIISRLSSRTNRQTGWVPTIRKQ